MRHLWVALGVCGRLLTALAWLVLVAIVLAVPAYAQTVTSTRIESASWTCRDASGAVLTSHERQDKAQEECTNRALASPGVDFEIRPSGFRITAGAVTPPVPTLPAPGGVSATTSPNATNPANHNVALSWLSVAGATGYAIERCTGATCTDNFIALGTTTNTAYTNSNVPGGITYRYRIQGTPNGAWSALRNVTTPTAPPPPAGTGTASLSWSWVDKPPLNDDGSPLVDIVGYQVLYGTSPTALLPLTIVVGESASSYQLENLTNGTWYFALVVLAGDPLCLPPADCVLRKSKQTNLVTKVVQ